MSTLLIINNIPEFYHSSDVRCYFSQFVEIPGFECFHFRHRPEAQKTNCEDEESAVREKERNVKTTCCVIKIYNKHVSKFIKMYNRKHWINRNGNMIPAKCFISRIKVNENTMDSQDKKNYQTRGGNKLFEENHENFSSDDLKSLIELNPPALMPNGNVGTPTKHFLKLINECRLPPHLISKLGLVFPRTKSAKIYGSVPFDYGLGCSSKNHNDSDEELEVKTAKGQVLSSEFKNATKINAESTPRLVEDSESGEDDDTCEEWERHESLHNDVTSQERTKERLFEEEIELKWEKGGSGLVFYTDAQYWDEKDGDFDEKTTDDWDVDMSIYYEKGAGDKDSRDLIDMRRESMQHTEEELDTGKIGTFEKYTKGFGRKIMERQGWKDGQGLGSSVKGIPDAISNDGQNPKDKKGLGYYGEKLQRNVGSHKKRRMPGDVFISTKYDKISDIEESEPLYRSNLPTAMKFRKV